MKKVILFACILFATGSSFAAAPVSEKALKAFHATFKDAQNVVWSDADNVYTVKFLQQGINTFVRYDEEGNFLSSRRYYQGDKLPVDIQCSLKKKFSNKTVFGVTEYTIDSQVYYYVKMEDAKHWITVKVDNERNMEVTEKYEKI